MIFYYSVSSELNVVLIRLFLRRLVRCSSSLRVYWKTRRKRSTSQNQCSRLQTVTSLKHYTTVITTANILTNPTSCSAPPTIQVPHKDLCVQPGQPATFTAIITGRPAPKTEWYKVRLHTSVRSSWTFLLKCSHLCECRMKRSLQLMRM